MATPRRLRSDRGNAALQTAVILPGVLLLVFGIIQAGLWFYARNVAIAAAEEGSRAAAAVGASSSEGRMTAAGFTDRVGASLLRDVSVTATRGARTATVVVSGHSVSLIPGIPFRISQSSTSPVERTT